MQVSPIEYNKIPLQYKKIVFPHSLVSCLKILRQKKSILLCMICDLIHFNFILSILTYLLVLKHLFFQSSQYTYQQLKIISSLKPEDNKDGVYILIPSISIVNYSHHHDRKSYRQFSNYKCHHTAIASVQSIFSSIIADSY